MNQNIHTERGKLLNLGVVVGKQAELLGELSQLMASLDSADPKSLERVNNLLATGLKGLRGEATTLVNASLPDMNLARKAFLEKYRVSVIAESIVSFTLLKGDRILDLLDDAHNISQALYHRALVVPYSLLDWSTSSSFNSNINEGREFLIYGNVPGSSNKTRTEQVKFLKKQKLEMPKLEYLAVAHAAYFIATGKDLFAGNTVRARGGALIFSSDGLHVDHYGTDGDRNKRIVAASCSLSESLRSLI